MLKKVQTKMNLHLLIFQKTEYPIDSTKKDFQKYLTKYLTIYKTMKITLIIDLFFTQIILITLGN